MRVVVRSGEAWRSACEEAIAIIGRSNRGADLATAIAESLMLGLPKPGDVTGTIDPETEPRMTLNEAAAAAGSATPGQVFYAEEAPRVKCAPWYTEAQYEELKQKLAIAERRADSWKAEADRVREQRDFAINETEDARSEYGKVAVALESLRRQMRQLVEQVRP